MHFWKVLLSLIWLNPTLVPLSTIFACYMILFLLLYMPHDVINVGSKILIQCTFKIHAKGFIIVELLRASILFMYCVFLII